MSGGGSSSSSTSTTSNDNRMVLDGGSIGITSADNNTIQLLDAGAVSGALELAAKVIESGSKAIDQGVKIQEQQGVQLTEAYTDAKGTKDVLVIGGLLVGAVAIAYILKS